MVVSRILCISINDEKFYTPVLDQFFKIVHQHVLPKSQDKVSMDKQDKITCFHLLHLLVKEGSLEANAEIFWR